MYEQQDYPGAVRACHAFIARADVAYICFAAACRQKNLVEAKRWLTANSPESRQSLVSLCKKFGTDLGAPTLDCAHDVRDCKEPPDRARLTR
jgi:hypothetical protein